MPRILLLLCWAATALAATTIGSPSDKDLHPIVLATYNLENYVIEPSANRPLKSPQSRSRIRQCLLAMAADVLALQEVGGLAALAELRQSLAAEGLNYPHWEWVSGFDTNIQVALLSRLPIVARRPHTNDSFLLAGRRFRVSRGFLEVDLQASPHYRFTLLTAHLKSRRAVGYADEAEMREQEAILLRHKIEARLSRDPQANIVLLGDFNDVKDSKSIRTLLGRGRNGLVDTRPVEPNGDPTSSPPRASDPRQITWTYYYAKEDTYSRVDYILLSPGMAREWIPERSRVFTLAGWGLASDHRPILAAFHPQDR